MNLEEICKNIRSKLIFIPSHNAAGILPFLILSYRDSDIISSIWRVNLFNIVII